MNSDLMLEQREQRARYQDELVSLYNKRLVVIKANYPGADKRDVFVNYLVYKVFLLLRDRLDLIDYKATYTLEGLIIYLIIEDSLFEAKKVCIEVESSSLGRLSDLDVYDGTRQISRKELGYGLRKCFICDDDAIKCIRSQKHSYREVESYFKGVVVKDILSMNLEANLAVLGLINELCKPYSCGTVIIEDVGIHKDMDFKTFFRSIEVIYSELKEFDLIEYYDFNKLRVFGKKIEEKMFEATNSINTHKGAIFSILVVLAGMRMSKKYEDISNNIKVLTSEIMDDFKDISVDSSFTKNIYHKTNISGVRGYALNGYQSLFEVIEPFYAQEKDIMATYLLIISLIEDTTIIKRSSIEKLNAIQKYAKSIIKKPNQYQEFSSYCLDNNLSWGGAADILALVFILNFIKEYYY